MMKKWIAVLTAFALLALLSLPMAAREESDVIILHDCDKSFGGMSVDKNEYTEGNASVSGKLNGSSNVVSATFAPTDIADCDTVAFDLYVGDPEKMAAISECYFEISSAGTCDTEELQWSVSGQFKDVEIVEGWNTIYLDISSATSTTPAIDLSAVNYIRFYTFQSEEAAGMVYKMDNIRACYTGGEDFSDMNLTAYRGDNSDVNVIIEGQSAPDLSKRDEGITSTWGDRK